MPHHRKHIFNNLKKQIKGTQKSITILFTDLESSSAYWDTSGDMMGRLMIDYHNRLVFPIIKKFRGRVIKTIGDAVMASFKKPSNAVKAAIAIQQMMKKERIKNKKLPAVRIGIHTGRAIVEKNDVYGDMVNVASRIENRAKGNEILMSTRTARKMRQKDYFLEKKERFKPKGKKTEITVFKCNWRKAPDFIKNFNPDFKLILTPLQKLELIFASIATLWILYFLHIQYCRYLISDFEAMALLTLNPRQILSDFPVVAIIGGFVLLFGLFLLFRIKSIPLFVFKLINGGLGFCIGFFLYYSLTTLLSLNIGPNSDKTLYQSKHLFVTILEDDVPVLQKPVKRAPVLQHTSRGQLLLLSDVRKQNKLTWNKVLIGKEKFGWVLRVSPPGFGVEEKRLSLAEKFYIKMKDIYNLIFALAGFVWGFFRFRIRPV